MAASYFDIQGSILSIGRVTVKEENLETAETYFRKLCKEATEGKHGGCRGMQFARNGNSFVHWSVFESPEQVHAFMTDNRTDLIPIMSEIGATEEVDLKFYHAGDWADNRV